jgi:predicted nucleotidyltransferase
LQVSQKKSLRINDNEKNSDINCNVYTIKQIKSIIKPILHKYGITNINIFGSYARGEANGNSDIDIYCDRGNVKTFIDQGMLEDELEGALNKKVDIIFDSSNIDEYFKNQIMEDMINLW